MQNWDEIGQRAIWNSFRNSKFCYQTCTIINQIYNAGTEENSLINKYYYRNKRQIISCSLKKLIWKVFHKLYI